MNTKVFDLLVNNPPFYSDGTRKRGSTAYQYFWRGYDGVPKKVVKTSISEAAYLAGKEYKRRELAHD